MTAPAPAREPSGAAGPTRRRLRGLMSIAGALASGDAIDEVLQSVVESARTLLGADSSRLELVLPGEDVAHASRRLVAAAGTTRTPVGSIRRWDEGASAYVLATGRPVRALKLSDGLIDPPEAAGATSPYLRNESGIAVPLVGDGRIIGTLSVLDPTPFRFTPEDVEVMEQCAVLATLAIDAGRQRERERTEAARLRALYLATEQVGEGVALVGADGCIRYANPAYASLHGLTPAELPGRPIDELMGAGWDWPALVGRLGQAGELRTDARIWHRAGVPVDVELHARAVTALDGPGGDGVVVLVHEIADRKAAEARLHQQARSDSLTGLANRRSIIEAATAVLRPGHKGQVALLFVDLDRFKKINDGLGHRIGDVVLTEVAARFAAVVGNEGVLGRLGGDEFVVLMAGIDCPQAALAMAGRLAAGLDLPLKVEGRSLTVTASIGVAVADECSTVESMLRDADAAMYQAKAAGRDTQVLFDRRSTPSPIDELDLEQALRQAVAEGQLRLAFQPLVDLRNGRLEGYEALVRWAHPERGLLLPGAFLPLAEESGLVRLVGAWVLRRAAEEMVGHLRRFPHLTLGVNVSPRQLAGEQLVSELDETLERTGLPADHLMIEVTESLAMRPGFEDTLHRLRGRGIRLAIDDLGTGYSNLSHLKRLPVSALKIDQSFVAGLGTDERDRAIVATLLGLGRSLGMDVIAEGIETVAQLRTLRQLGCPLGQGNLLSPAAAPPDPDDVKAELLLP
ncbi:MAG TPA: EAL domain-containing protein [Acidimicrobiales bacterium]|nr:EAL domain-containing protein [Acidimicrobiales bacterium]